MTDPSDLLDRIDQITTEPAATCWHCKGPLGGSVSDDFCSDWCQQAWHEDRNNNPLLHYREPDDLPVHIYNQVETPSAETAPSFVAASSAWTREQRGAFVDVILESFGLSGRDLGFAFADFGNSAGIAARALEGFNDPRRFTFRASSEIGHWWTYTVSTGEPEPQRHEAQVYTTPIYDEHERLDQPARSTLSFALDFARGQVVTLNGARYTVTEVRGNEYAPTLALVPEGHEDTQPARRERDRDPMRHALDARRERGTGPQRRQRAPRSLGVGRR